MLKNTHIFILTVFLLFAGNTVCLAGSSIVSEGIKTEIQSDLHSSETTYPFLAFIISDDHPRPYHAAYQILIQFQNNLFDLSFKKNSKKVIRIQPNPIYKQIYSKDPAESTPSLFSSVFK